jgi:hypothetical protein
LQVKSTASYPGWISSAVMAFTGKRASPCGLSMTRPVAAQLLAALGPHKESHVRGARLREAPAVIAADAAGAED